MNLFKTPEWETDSQNEKKFSVLFGGNKNRNDKDQKLKEKKKKKKTKNMMGGSSESNNASTIFEKTGKPKGKYFQNNSDFEADGGSVPGTQQKKNATPKRLFKKKQGVKENQMRIKSKNILQGKETASKPVPEGIFDKSSKLKKFLKLQKKKEKAKNSEISSKEQDTNIPVMHSPPAGLATTTADRVKKIEVKHDITVEKKKLKRLLQRRRRREKLLAERKQKDGDKTLEVNEVCLNKKQEKKMRKVAENEAKTMKQIETSNEVHLSKKQKKKMRKIAEKETKTMKQSETSNEVRLNKKQEKKMRKIAGKEAKTVKGFQINIGKKALTRKSDASYDNSALEKPLEHPSPLKQNDGKKLKKRERKRKRKNSVESSSDALDGNYISSSNGQVQEDIPSDNSVQRKKLFKIKNKKIKNMLKDVEPMSVDIESKNTLYSLKKKRMSENQTASVTSSKKLNKNLTPLRERMTEQLKSARFRWLNEQLYTSNSWDALKYFKEDPEAYEAYHHGYRSQVAHWPLNPVDVIIKDLSSSPPGTVVADFGCGEARLEECLPKLKVHSLDLVASKPNVVACDMAHTPLLMGSVNVAVFCLSLMGTNLNDFLLEANRVLKVGGVMKIAEVESRFEDVDNFTSELQQFGFQLKKKDFSHKLFYFMDFKKIRNVSKTGKLPSVALSPCVYKKR